jgi:hypothetical protein
MNHNHPSQANDLDRSIQQTIKDKHDSLCQHPTSHTDGVGGMLRCCVRKRLFKEMLEALPTLLPVSKQL